MKKIFLFLLFAVAAWTQEVASEREWIEEQILANFRRNLKRDPDFTQPITYLYPEIDAVETQNILDDVAAEFQIEINGITEKGMLKWFWGSCGEERYLIAFDYLVMDQRGNLFWYKINVEEVKGWEEVYNYLISTPSFLRIFRVSLK